MRIKTSLTKLEIISLLEREDYLGERIDDDRIHNTKMGKYCFAVRNRKYIKKSGSQHLEIMGFIYEEDNYSCIELKPKLNAAHIIALIILIIGVFVLVYRHMFFYLIICVLLTIVVVWAQMDEYFSYVHNLKALVNGY